MTTTRDRPPARAGVTVLVTGMHRSGTSAVAGALMRAGLFGGRAGEFHLPAADNPLGFAELRQATDFNDLLLSALGWTWDAPAPAPLAGYAVLDGFVDRGRALIADLLARPDGAAAVLKDPRISVLLPCWRKILLDQLVVVVALRQPDEVARSLAVRNGFHVELGRALWNAYHRHLVPGLDGLPVIFVEYVKLVQDPPAVMARLLTELGQFANVGSLDAGAGAAWVEPQLRRSTDPVAPPAGNSEELARTVFGVWSADSVTAYHRFSSEPLAAYESWEEALLDTQRAARQREVERETAADELDVLRGERDALTTERDALSAERDALSAERDALSAERDALSAEQDALRSENAARGTELDRLLRDRQQLLAKQDELRRSVDVYAQSTSWRVTAPLRRLGKWIRRLLRRSAR